MFRHWCVVVLGLKPPAHMLMEIMPALWLHLGREDSYQRQQQQQQHALHVFEVPTAPGHHPGKQVGQTCRQLL
jgi:hypothetical protein